jgi:hypothetical protein
VISAPATATVETAKSAAMHAAMIALGERICPTSW